MGRDDDEFGKTFDFSEMDAEPDDAPAPAPEPVPAAPVATPAPGAPASGGSSAGFVFGGVALVGAAGIALLGFVALGAGLWLTTSSSPSSPARQAVVEPAAPKAHPSGCPIGKEGTIGWVRTDTMKIRKGNVHTLSRPTALVTKAGGTNVVCTLPAGTSIYAAKSTRTNIKGAWLQVYGTAVTVP